MKLNYFIILILFQQISEIYSASVCGIFKNTIFTWRGSDCGRGCDQRNKDIFCENNIFSVGCFCKENYYRNWAWDCVEGEQCDKDNHMGSKLPDVLEKKILPIDNYESTTASDDSEQSETEKPPENAEKDEEEICSEPMDRGNCSSNINSWYFDATKGECFRFSYSGCGGNANNFKAKPECERVCNPPISVILARSLHSKNHRIERNKKLKRMKHKALEKLAKDD